MNFLKNKVVIGLIVVVLLGIVAGWFLFLRGGSSSPTTTGEEVETVKQIKPEDIGLELELAADKKNVIMTITKLDGIESFEYELSYDAEETIEGETANVPKGALSSTPIEVKGKSKVEQKIFLGTCSANVCRPDRVTSDIKVLVKVNYTNGEVAAAESSVPFEAEE